MDADDTARDDSIVIMVDELHVWPNAKHRCFKKGSCHLTVNGDSDEHMAALHAFAKTIGMKRSWFQPHRLAPHYDLTPSRRADAVSKGAVEVSAVDQAIARRERRARRA